MTKKKQVARGHWENFENCLAEAKKHNTKKEFFKGSRGAYDSSRRNGWLDDIYSNFPDFKKPHHYWNKERCVKAARQCKSKRELVMKFGGAFGAIKRNNWIEEIEDILDTNYNNYCYHKCQTEALQYTTRSQFYRACPGEYSKAKKQNILDSICSHMKNGQKLRYYWTYERCEREAFKYSNQVEFYNSCPEAYLICVKNEWIPKLAVHMPENSFLPKNYPKLKKAVGLKSKIQFPRGYWTYEACKKHALECSNKSEYGKKYGKAYNLARKNKWLDEFFPQ